MECGVSNSPMIVPNSSASEVGMIDIVNTTMMTMTTKKKDDGSNDDDDNMVM